MGVFWVSGFLPPFLLAHIFRYVLNGFVSITFLKEIIMDRPTMKIALLTCVSLLCFTLLPTQMFSQNITELELQNLTDISFDVTITYDDNSTETIALNAEDETLVTAPTGKSMLTLTAGTKTVALPMTPSPQTGWNIPGTPLEQTVSAFSRTDNVGWRDLYTTPSISFTY